MDFLNLEEFKALTARYPDWCISLYMPTHRTRPETEQDKIRLRNLLRQAEERLKDKGLRSPEVAGLLHPAERLLQDSSFWRHQSDGLAVFLSPEGSSSYRLPLQFEELLVITNRFHLKPLLPLFTSDGHFFILALSQKQIRLLEATRHSVDEIELKNVPKSLAEILSDKDLQRQLQFHTRAPGKPGERAGVFHGHDEADKAKTRLLQYFRRINAGLNDVLREQRSPLILAAVDYLIPLYKQANSYQHLLDESITGNPETLKAQELQERAWTIAEPHFQKAQQAAIALYAQLEASGQTSTDIGEVLQAAQHGRVDQLLVALGVQQWGTFDKDSGEAHIRQEAAPGDEDLLDLAAVETIVNGGAVYALKPEQMPQGSSLAAMFRY